MSNDKKTDSKQPKKVVPTVKTPGQNKDDKSKSGTPEKKPQFGKK